jgi:BAAT / Acyl-CoA thioester hydrolase C terminal
MTGTRSTDRRSLSSTLMVPCCSCQVVMIASGATGRMYEMIVDRMSRHGRSGDVKHLHYPGVGHMLFPYLHPSDAMFPAYPLDHGGSAIAAAAAHAAAWSQVVEHLSQAL